MVHLEAAGMRSVCLCAALLGLACGQSASPDGAGGAAHGGSGPIGTAGASAVGGASSPSGGSVAAGGVNASGNASATAGAAGNGTAGGVSAGGAAGAGGTSSAGGMSGAGAGDTAPSTGCGTAPSLKSGRATLDVGGTQREYVLRLPDDYKQDHPYKLIFAFHARGGSAAQVTGASNNDYYGLFARAGGEAIFVSPEGQDMGFRNANGVDIAFVKAMLTEFGSKLCIDQRRIFSTGFSFGGMMSDAIGCAMGDVFRAIAPMSGAIPNAEHPYSGCDQVNMHPIAVWMSHGDNDTVVPLADGKDALAVFVAKNKCQAKTAPVDPSPCVAYQGCTEGYPIHFCQFSGSHGVPSFAPAAVWAFFDQF